MRNTNGQNLCLNGNLLKTVNGAPDWNSYDFEDYPAVQWKLQNLRKLKETNPDKQSEQLKKLKTIF